MSEQETPILEVREVTKRFPGVVALDSVSFQLRAGEVHALVGENGAGKSTLIKVITGVYRPDGGQVLFGGEEVRSDLARAMAARFPDCRFLHVYGPTEAVTCSTHN